MVGCECGVGTALGGVDGVSLCGVGSDIITEQHSLSVVANRNNVFRNYIIPFFHQHRDMLTFQKVNARANSNVPLFGWPALSPDLSPREHLWDYFGQRVSRIPHMNNLRNWKTHYNRSGMLLPRTLFAELSG